MRIVFIGAGNVATNLAVAIRKSGHEVVQVYSRTEESAGELAHKTEAEAITRLDRIVADADIYFIAVKDDAIEEVLSQFPHNDVFLVHTAGSISMNMLRDYTDDYGVLYPLQTFSKDWLSDFTEIPLCIEANTDRNLNILGQIAEELSNNVCHIDTMQRLYLHVAAVFACNFTNFMFASAENILRNHDISFNVLKPLIRETVDKALVHSPSRSQSGPAVRGDREIIEKHLDLLAHSGKLQNLYKYVSESIMDFYNSAGEGE
ncbi:MAG: DUF2520 domain-containing protein [Bacteroidales bacterium]|nr:DUF2520 domain-containing protein [Bacteroidales bacterium]